MTTANPPTRVPKPAHVPDHLVADVDFYNLPGMEEDAQLAWLALKCAYPPIFWTPFNGGHWIATASDDIKALHTDHERFSHSNIMLPLMKLDKPLIPIMLDPPEHTPFRRLIMPLFSPARLDKMEARARQIARELVEEMRPRGECEFIEEFSDLLPIVVFLEMMGLPVEDRHWLKPLAEATAHGSSLEERAKARATMSAYVEKWMDVRLAEPGDDAISVMVHAEVNGSKLPHEDAKGIVTLLLGGGLDTVANLMGFIMAFLARNPAHRQQLVDDPELIPNAVEELIRRHGISNTAREVTHDFEYKGVQFAKGDMVQQPNALYGLDDELMDDPLTVDFHRERPIIHAAFGSGPHVCPGSMLARRECKVFLQEWLRCIPEFSIKPGTRPRHVAALLNGIKDVHLVWEV